MKLAPATQHNEINARINAALANGYYADASTFEMRFIRRECEKVRDVEAFMGWALLGAYYTLLGDSEESERCFAASMRLVRDMVVNANYHTNLGNLGYFSTAHKFFVEHGSPEKGSLSMLIPGAQTMGSFQAAAAFAKEAKVKGVAIGESITDTCLQAAAILEEAGVSDEQIVLHMDAAGEVLRRRRMFFHGNPRVSVSNVEGVFVGVTCVLAVTGTPMDVFEMNVELAELEQELGVVKHPAFDVMFKPV